MVEGKHDYLLISAIIIAFVVVATWAMWPPVLQRLETRQLRTSRPTSLFPNHLLFPPSFPPRPRSFAAPARENPVAHNRSTCVLGRCRSVRRV